jgi:hypothetical protein
VIRAVVRMRRVRRARTTSTGPGRPSRGHGVSRIDRRGSPERVPLSPGDVPLSAVRLVLGQPVGGCFSLDG